MNEAGHKQTNTDFEENSYIQIHILKPILIKVFHPVMDRSVAEPDLLSTKSFHIFLFEDILHFPPL